MARRGTVAEIAETLFNHEEAEARLAALWEEHGIYRFDPDSEKPVYSIDTPPPYVSAAHLHVGHAMSYSQAEFIVRYRRMRGFNVFYPMGFDDNGLPTERYVEQTYKINKQTISRNDFRKLCIEETAKGAETYEKMWRALGLSVDWRLRYSTIDEHCRRTAQKSFIDLYRKGLIHRSDEPVLWDTVYDTALAQADLDTISRKGKLFDIAFHDPEGKPLVISTTRPELIPACVGMFFHPEDERYQHLIGQKAVVPLFGHQVPVLPSEDVDPAFGTGLMMCCTFGDGEDVKKWKQHNLETRIVITRRGKMTELAGKYEGMDIGGARSSIVKDLKEAGHLLGEKTVEQNVAVGERSGQPVEFMMVPQWFINVLDHKEEFLKRSEQLGWFPPHMKVRLDQWIEGLKYDWNISRQRFYGVPFPVWYVQETGDVILADEADLPIDPLENQPPAWAKEKYKGMTIVGEPDVMDTWMTSSLTPLINANWAGTPGRLGDMALYPMSLRVQAFEIIRTWLFYTLVKGHFHEDTLPWDAVMISGWGLNEQGKKISKRDLEQYTDETGFNRYDPYSIVRKYGADALRYWAAGSRLGHDLRFNEKDVQAGRKLVTKLWNVARLCTMYLKDFDPTEPAPPVAERPLEDRWLLHRLYETAAEVAKGFEENDYAIGREALEKFFWGTYCDNYLEIVKDRFRRPDLYGPAAGRAAAATLYDSFRLLLSLYAPFLPFITDELYQRIFRGDGDAVSIHVTDWPDLPEDWASPRAEAEMATCLHVLDALRFHRSADKIQASRGLISLTVDTGAMGAEAAAVLAAHQPTLTAMARTTSLTFGPADRAFGEQGLKISFEPEPPTARE